MQIEDIPKVDFTDPATVRLIATAYIREPAIAPLADSDADLRDLEALEVLTSRRHDRDMPLPAGLRRAELLTPAHGYGWAYINAAFCYTRPSGNRFNGHERGAWYASHGAEAGRTAQAEVGWHLARELENTGIYANVTDYRELIAGFTANFADLRALPEAVCLDPDPRVGYPAGQALARALLAVGTPGVLYPSRRNPGGQCLVALRPMLVQNIRPGATWRFIWAGSAIPAIRKVI